jgi:malate dehydrogenase
MGVLSDGSYGVPAGLIFGFPCICEGGKWQIVKGLEIDAFTQEKINLTLKEIQEERDAVQPMLG